MLGSEIPFFHVTFSKLLNETTWNYLDPRHSSHPLAWLSRLLFPFWPKWLFWGSPDGCRGALSLYVFFVWVEPFPEYSTNMGLGGEQCCLRLDFSTFPAHREHHHSLDTRSHSSAIAFSAGICPTCTVMVQGGQKSGAPRSAVGVGLGKRRVLHRSRYGPCAVTALHTEDLVKGGCVWRPRREGNALASRALFARGHICAPRPPSPSPALTSF